MTLVAPARANGYRALIFNTAALRLDPRTKFGLVILIGLTLFAPGGELFLPAALVLAVLLWCSAGRPLIALGVTLGVPGALALAEALPWWVPGAAAASLSFVLGLLARFAVLGSVAGYFLQTTGPAAITAALLRLRFPRVIAVPLIVMIRFLPVVLGEARGVTEAIRLSAGGSARAMVLHPVRTVEMLIIPMVSSSLRAAEHLTAAALLRGLGTKPTAGPTSPPTSMQPLHFRVVDATVVVLVVILAAATWVVHLRWPGVLR